jgi:threonine 3-dehydrogenase
MPEKMRAVVKTEPGPGAALITVEIPQIGPKDVLVRVRATAICGTDAHIYQWNQWAQDRIKPPLIMGHEFEGEIVALGEEVETLKVGDSVSAETHIVCGVCYQCRTGQSHVCQNYSIIGVDRSGCFAEYVALPAENAWLNPPDLPLEVASIQEPFGNAVHAAFSYPLTAQRVLVTGCGPIGLMAIGIAKTAGAACVYASEVIPYRLDLAHRMGADLVFDATKVDVAKEVWAATDGEGVDLLLEMSGHPSAIHQGLKALRNGGHAALLGIPSQPLEIDLAEEIIFKGITVRGVVGRLIYETWYRTQALLISGTVDVSPIITHRLPLEDFEKGMELMRAGQCGKVVLFP